MPRPLVLLAVTALLGACGSGTAESAPVESGPITAEAIIAIAGDHLDDPTRSGPHELDGSDPKRSVLARLTYGDQHVDVVVGPRREEDVAGACAESYLDCAELETGVAGATLTLVWQEEVPEEDPGIVVLLLEREAESSMVRWGGDVTVVGDPRELDLAVPVEDAVDLLEDERLRREVP